MNSITILLAAAAAAGFIHTIIGADHYLPFIVMSKARNWSLKKTLFTTFYCGLGHVASSIIIGFIGIALGYGISQIEGVFSVRGNLAGWAFFAFGLSYMVWGIFQAVKNRAHTFQTDQSGMHEQKSARLLTPWVLFIIFVLGPCEILIPLVMVPAANQDTHGIIAVSLLFSTVTVLTMCAAVTIGYYGFKALPTAKIDRFMHAIAGATICLSGFAMLFLDM
jgi:sulfite exporter TauE/SafE